MNDASLMSGRETDFIVSTKFLLLRRFVPQKESFECIKVKVKTVQSVIRSTETNKDNK